MFYGRADLFFPGLFSYLYFFVCVWGCRARSEPLSIIGCGQKANKVCVCDLESDFHSANSTGPSVLLQELFKVLFFLVLLSHLCILFQPFSQSDNDLQS